MATQMNRETILRMVADRKITPEEAAELIEALDEAERKPAPPPPTPIAPRPPKAAGAGKFLRVMVKVDGNGDENVDNVDVDINVPINLAKKIAPMLGGMIPQDAQERMESKGVDLEMIAGLLSSLDEELMEGRDIVNISAIGDDGETVKVRIYVE